MLLGSMTTGPAAVAVQRVQPSALSNRTMPLAWAPPRMLVVRVGSEATLLMFEMARSPFRLVQVPLASRRHRPPSVDASSRLWLSSESEWMPECGPLALPSMEMSVQVPPPSVVMAMVWLPDALVPWPPMKTVLALRAMMAVAKLPTEYRKLGLATAAQVCPPDRVR